MSSGFGISNSVFSYFFASPLRQFRWINIICGGHQPKTTVTLLEAREVSGFFLSQLETTTKFRINYDDEFFAALKNAVHILPCECARSLAFDDI